MNLSIPKEVVERLEQEAFFLGCSAQELVERVIKEKFKPIKRSTQSYPEYKVFMDAYFVFFDQQTGVNPKISAADGKAAKSIIKHLRTVNEGDAVNNWISILAHWSKLDQFIRKQVDLRNIDSNLNKIIYELTSKKQRQISSSDLKGL